MGLRPAAQGAACCRRPWQSWSLGVLGFCPVPLKPGGHAAAQAGQTTTGCAAAGRSSEPQHASEPEASSAGAELLQAPMAGLESGRIAAGPPHEPESLPFKPGPRRSARVAARLARKASRGREISMPTGRDVPAPKRVCTEARRSAGCARPGVDMQIAGSDGAHTDGEDLRRPGEQEPAGNMTGAAAAAGLPAGPGQGARVAAGLAAPIAAAAAAGTARPAAALGLNRAAGFAALHSQGAAQGRPGSLGSPAECARDAAERGAAPRSRQAPTEESAWDRMQMWLLAACKAVRLPADSGTTELAGAHSR